MRVDLTGIYKDYEEKVNNSIKYMINKYAVLEEIVEIIHLHKMNEGFEECFATSELLYGNSIKYEIKLNPIAFSNPNIESKFIITRPSAYYFEIGDIIVHEMGHALQIFYLCKYLNVDLKNYKRFWRFKYKKIISKQRIIAFQEYFKPFLHKYNWTDDMIKNNLGYYAYKNVYELLPECFNNYYHLSKMEKLEDAEKETYEFVKAVVDDYKKYIPDKM